MRTRLETSLVLAAISGLYLYTASSGAILDDGDALYSGVARQMVERGDWVTPWVNGVRFLDKPPLMYWLMALSFKVFGFTELAARIPTVLAVVGTAWILYLLGSKTGSAACGTTAALAMSLAPGTFLFTHMVFPDMLFVFMLTLGLYGFFRWYAAGGEGSLPAVLFYAGMAGAVLSKGLIGVIFPAAIVVLFLWLNRRFSWLWRFHLGKGSLLFLLLALPWHVLAARRIPGFLWYFFVNEHFLRFLGKRQPLDYESIPLIIFWGLLAAWLFPWAAFFGAIPGLVSKAGVQPSPRRELISLSFSWIAVVFVFFSLSSRIEHYSLPIFPPLALTVGVLLSGLGISGSQQRWVDRGFHLLGFLAVAVIVVATAAFWIFEFEPGATGPHTHAYSYYFAPLFDLPTDVRLGLRPPLVTAALGVSLGIFVAWWFNRRGSRRSAVLALAAGIAIFCLSASYSFRVCEPVLTSRQFAAALNGQLRPGDRLVVAGDYETANSLNFYTNASIEVYGGRAAVLEWGLRYPDAARIILTKADLETGWAGPDRVFLLAPERDVPGFNLGQYFAVQSSGGRVLLCNKPVRQE